MLGKTLHRNPKLFYVGVNIEERIPADNPYRRILQSVSFDRVRDIVAQRYGSRGHESLDPVVVLKLMLILFIEQVRSERELVRHLPLRLDWLWFCQMDLDSVIPHHSVLSKARARWGLDVFEQLFADILTQCEAAGLIEGRTVFGDSTVLKANADVQSRMSRRLWNQLEEGLKQETAAAESPALPPAAPPVADLPSPPDSALALPASSAPAPRLALTPREILEQPPAGAPESLPAKKMDLDSITPRRTPAPPQDTQAASLPALPTGDFNTQWVSRTDPDAATTFRRGKGVTLGYRDHTLVDNKCGIILATVVTSADYDDADLLPVLLNQAEKYVEVRPREAVADSQYGSEKNQLRLKRRGIDDYLKRRVGKKSGSSWLDLLDPALPKGRAIHLMKRRMHVAEGRFAMAHSRMNHRRCRWRRRYRVQTQAYLVAMAQNMHKLTRHGGRPPQNRANRVLSAPAALQNLHHPSSCRRLWLPRHH